MSDSIPVDVMTKPPIKEMPPSTTGSPAPKEKHTGGVKKEGPTQGAARKALEDIAKGKPVAEALAPTEPTPSTQEASAPKAEASTEQSPALDREVVSQVLTEANGVLLNARDSRVLITALATQAADTPLGNEMRVETVRMIGTMSNEGMPPEAVLQLDQLQKKISTLNIPNAKPEQSQLLQTIQIYNEKHPENPVAPELIDQIKHGNIEAAPSVAKLLQGNDALAAAVWKDLTGLDNFTGFDITPKRILELTQMDTTEENMKKMNEIFGAIKKRKEPIDLMGNVVPGIIIGAMSIMFVSQIAGVDQGAGGH